MTEQPARWRDRRVLGGAVLVLVALLVVIFAVARSGPSDAEQQEMAEQWQQELDAWARDATERTGPEGTEHPRTSGHDLTEHFDPAMTEPVRDPSQATIAAEEVDEVNAACTATNSLVEIVEDMVEPPAPPRDLDEEHPAAESAVQDFETARAALADYREQLSGPGSQLRGFCGTYPALLTTHFNASEAGQELTRMVTCTEEACVMEEDDESWVGEIAEAAMVEPNRFLAQEGLPACYLDQMVDVCRADVEEANALADLWADWRQQLRSDPQAAAQTVAQAQELQDRAADDLSETVGDVGQSRDEVREAAVDELDGLVAALDEAASQFEDALGGIGSTG